MSLSTSYKSKVEFINTIAQGYIVFRYILLYDYQFTSFLISAALWNLPLILHLLTKVTIVLQKLQMLQPGNLNLF